VLGVLVGRTGVACGASRTLQGLAMPVDSFMLCCVLCCAVMRCDCDRGIQYEAPLDLGMDQGPAGGPLATNDLVCPRYSLGKVPRAVETDVLGRSSRTELHAPKVLGNFFLNFANRMCKARICVLVDPGTKYKYTSTDKNTHHLLRRTSVFASCPDSTSLFDTTRGGQVSLPLASCFLPRRFMEGLTISFR